jgi:hypothetical protein
MAKRKEEEKALKPIAKNVTLTVNYDRKRRESRIIADFGGICWIAGPWAGDYRGKEVSIWNKHRDRFEGEMKDLRDAMPLLPPTPPSTPEK